MAENSKRKWIIAIIAIALVIVLALLLTGRGHGPRVQVAAVTREDLTSAITSNGKVEPVAPMTARAEFATFVTEVKAPEGQAVHRGQVILVLDDADIRAQLSQARANLLAAKTDLQNGRTGGPPDEVAQLQGDLANAQTQVANLERSQQALQGLLAKQAATQDEVAQNAAALLLDEPSTFLDIEQQLHCFSVLRDEARAGKLCIAATHDLNLALTHCTRLLVLANGIIAHDIRTAEARDNKEWLGLFSKRLNMGTTPSGSPWVWYQ